ncbi:MAG TPA: acyl-CoA dehydrogenase, partial [Dehalococcoidales bacterium]|nr:acyl-CoA dehydrogenase [Dehalococcoidales bacterium]
EEAGRALLQSPHFNTVVLGAQLILAAGSEEQKKTLLAKITSGELILSVAIKEKGAESDVSLVKTAAKAAANGYTINGSKVLVSSPHIADKMLVVAKIGRKIGLLLVDSKAAGVTLIPMQSMTGEALFEVDLKDVAVSADALVGEPVSPDVIAGVVEKTKIMTCSAMVGMCQPALEMAIDYSKERKAFGHPIGSFQALQHKMARIAMAIDGARWLTYYTAWKLDKGAPAESDIAMTKLFVGQAAALSVSEASQVHGAVGVFRDHNLTLYFTRVMAEQLSLGQKYDMLETIAQSLGI